MSTIDVSDIMSGQFTGRLWILNRVDSVVQGGGDAHVTIMHGGNPADLHIPRTWIPIEATARFPLSSISTSISFIDAVSKGLIQCITQEEASAILKQPGAREELARLQDYMRSQRTAVTTNRKFGSNVSVSGSSADMADAEEGTKKNASSRVSIRTAPTDIRSSVNVSDFLNPDNAQELEADEDVRVTPQFIAWVQKVNASASSAVASNELRRRSSMSTDELSYLAENISFPDIKALLLKAAK